MRHELVEQNMNSKRQSVDEDGMYFSRQESIDKVLQQRKFDSGKLEEEPEYGEEISDPPDHVPSNVSGTEYYEYDDIKSEYVLPKQNPKTIPSRSHVTPKLSKKKDVQDLYDEDGYALPDINGCVTKDIVGERNTKISSEAKESKLWDNKIKITGVVILLLILGGIGGIIVTVVTGIKSLFSDI